MKLRTSNIGLVVTVVALALSARVLHAAKNAAPKPLQTTLSSEDPLALAKAARERGDATRGALVFYQPHLTCVRCHAQDEGRPRLGPDLATLGKETSDVHLVESLLHPSNSIKKGFETVSVVTTQGNTVTGLFAEETAERLVLRDPAQDGKAITISRADIDSRNDKNPSIMPESLVNLLAGRQEFLDLLRYLIEIAEKGPAQALELRPPSSLFAPPPLPDYERRLDHARLIRTSDAKSLKQGEMIYNRVCANCHGTKDREGSLPTSLRFASGKFKNGSDPLRMYQTLTHGYGLMTPQPWLTPRQKYDVIHYVREVYLKRDNPGQYVVVDANYLSRLPSGTELGPTATLAEPWVNMDYGPSLTATYEAGRDGRNFAYKGIAVRLDAGPGGVSRGRLWTLFDHDTLRMAAAWSGAGFIDFSGINFNGAHGAHPRLVGKIHFADAGGPAWANPNTGRFDDPRQRGRDQRAYGPLPRAWARYRGLYHYGQQTLIAYSVGHAAILEMPGYESMAAPGASPREAMIYSRTLNVGQSPHDLTMRVASEKSSVVLVGGASTKLIERDGQVLLEIPAAATPVQFKLLYSDGNEAALKAHAASSPPPLALAPFTKGGPRRWPQTLMTKTVSAAGTRAFAVDALTLPTDNPWHCQMRPSGFDFFADGKRAAVCTWDGDVWIVDGLGNESGELTWQRIASGLFQPLGLKIVRERIYVGCRDQICILNDLNDDGETDFYECFNSDHQVTEHFHEFAMGLQTDAAGNFYYAKAARHALPAVVPHHGTLLRVSADGSRTDILATGFRAPNGVCLNKDGTFFLTDQEGHWMPKNRINWVKDGGYYGNFLGYHDVVDSSDRAMKQPVCWITNASDRSPSELLWVDSPKWKPLQGALLNFSYGYGKTYVVPHERINGEMQGGISPLPIPQFPTGVMRGRFNPRDGQLYCCGMFAWAGNQVQPGGFYRVRYAGQPLYVPVGLKARKTGMSLTFSGPLHATSVSNVRNFSVKTWSLKRSVKYGSDHIDERPLEITRAELSTDRKTVHLALPAIRPTWCMQIKYSLRAADGESVVGVVDNTVHRLGED